MQGRNRPFLNGKKVLDPEHYRRTASDLKTWDISAAANWHNDVTNIN